MLFGPELERRRGEERRGEKRGGWRTGQRDQSTGAPHRIGPAYCVNLHAACSDCQRISVNTRSGKTPHDAASCSSLICLFMRGDKLWVRWGQCRMSDVRCCSRAHSCKHPADALQLLRPSSSLEHRSRGCCALSDQKLLPVTHHSAVLSAAHTRRLLVTAAMGDASDLLTAGLSAALHARLAQ